MQSQATETERLRTARELWGAGRYREARAELDAHRSSYVPDYVAALRAQMLYAEGDSTAALLAADQALQLDPPPELRARVLLQIADMELERGEVASAYASARLAWDASRDAGESSQGAFRFAEELEQRGFPGEALLLYRAVWERWPTSGRAGLALARSRALTDTLGADRPEVGSLLEAGERLRSLFRCTEAGEFFTEVLERPESDRDARRRAERGRADCAFQQRRYAEAVAQYRKLVSDDPTDFDAAILAARARGRSGDPHGAVRELETLARKVPPDTKPRVQQLIAIFVADDDRPREARMLRELAEQNRAPEIAVEARWRLAWLDIEAHRYQSARRWLEPLASGPKFDVEVQRARYWSAVALSSLDAQRGEDELRAIAEELPTTYYGLLAADRLGSQPKTERSFLAARSDAPKPREAERAGILVASGWDELARVELRSWVSGRSLGRESRLEASRLLHDLGDHFAAAQLVIDGFGGDLDAGVDPLWRDAWRCAWPEPFNANVRSAVSEFEFDPALVYAIMREESLYRPQIESPAGARGLMQLIPPTAQRIARVLSVDGFTPDALYEPETNVRFGTYYLKELMTQFGGSRPLAIAAYNAGPDAVRNWLERGGNMPDDRFVDSVPYGETRRYLRKVLRSYRMYRLLYPETEAAASPAGAPEGVATQSPVLSNR